MKTWACRYDSDLKTDDSSDASEKGTYVHKALDIWKNPANGYGSSFEEFKRAYVNAAPGVHHPVSWAVYQAGFDLLPKAFEFTVSHPFLPLERTRIWQVEAKIDMWKANDAWALPLFGFVDTLEIVTPRAAYPHEIILVVGDYKTGRTKTKEELMADIQPALYLLWAIHVAKRILEGAGFTVLDVMNVWTYIAEPVAVVLKQDDFDLEAIAGYAAGISQKMVLFAAEYNCKKPEERLSFLEKYEKRNDHCNWCVAKGICTQFKRAVLFRAEIDLAKSSMDEICAERDAAALAEKEGKDQKSKIDRMLYLYLQQENLDAVRANNRVYKIVKNSSRVVRNDVYVAAFGGPEFLVRNGTVTQKVVDKELEALRLTDPQRYAQVSAFIAQNTVIVPGGGWIKASDPPKTKEEKQAAKLLLS